MSEEKKAVEKKDEQQGEKKSTAATVSVKPATTKKSSDLLSWVAIILSCLMAVAVISGFLNSQKLNKQVVDLDRKLTALQSEENEVGQRVLALEDEFVVMGLKHRMNRIKKSRKNLASLQAVLSDNPEMTKKVQALVDDLGLEEKRLQKEILSSAPKEFKATRPRLHNAEILSHQPAGYQCCPKSGKCILLPNVQDTQHQLKIEPVVPASGGHGSMHNSTPKVATAPAKPQTGWTKFINLRLFGN